MSLISSKNFKEFIEICKNLQLIQSYKIIFEYSIIDYSSRKYCIQFCYTINDERYFVDAFLFNKSFLVDNDLEHVVLMCIHENIKMIDKIDNIFVREYFRLFNVFFAQLLLLKLHYEIYNNNNIFKNNFTIYKRIIKHNNSSTCSNEEYLNNYNPIF